jgi:L-alanine-DL-glutamate epimerase-like enolase superfamily enzyme
MKFSLKQTRFGLRNSVTRIPFRYGKACLTACPQAVLGATIEVGDRAVQGFAGDCLPPGWFDKTPGKDFAAQIDDMLAVIALAEKTFLEEAATPVELFPAWLIAHERIHSRAAEWGYGGLLASFGVSMVERAVIDALARAAKLSFADAVRNNIYAITAGEIHADLAGLQPRDWLPFEPLRSVFVRHTVGLGDPLTIRDIPLDERLDDGFPQALEEYVERTGTRYFKVKVSNNLDHDLGRLTAFAEIVERHLGGDYRITLDGNEQYKAAAEFDALIDALESRETLATLWRNTMAIEQPLERSVALDAAHTGGIRDLATRKPVIIDESDGQLDSYRRAIELGYRGVSSKNCKGTFKSLLNAGLTWHRNDRGRRDDFLMTGEDLCSVGIIPVQADLCLAATLGLEHVERNGHHYHPGLTYLPEPQRNAALRAHPDFYTQQHGRISPHVQNGRFEIGSLQCVGFGFAVEPDFATMEPPEAWRFESLGDLR